MNEFKYENQGIYTYLVYEMKKEELIDTLSLGMITNNKIKGVLPVIFTQMDDTRYLKYNVSSQVSLRQFFEGTATKKRLLGVFLSIASGILEAEEYMIDAGSFMLDLDYIFVDVTASEASLICLPVVRQESANYEISRFFKEIVFSTQFDQSENCDYVAKLISFLNCTGTFSLDNFKRVVESLLYGQNNPNRAKAKPEDSAQRPIQPARPVPPIPQSQPVMASQPQPVSQEARAIPPSRPAAEIPKAMVPQNNNDSKNIKKKEPQIVTNSVGRQIAVPGMKPEETSQPKEEGKKKGLWSLGRKKEDKKSKIQLSVPVPPMPDTSYANANKPVPMPTAGQAVYQNVGMPLSQEVPPIAATCERKGDFGETTVLSNAMDGGTVVLGPSAQNTFRPYLVRLKSREIVYLDKPVFRIGKEKNFVDYFIGDNAAVSRSHASILTKGNNVYIIDTNSKNHTYINGQQISSNVEIPLKHGMKILLANEEFEYMQY
ncbi:DUF6382 domain-containing protein [Anaerocolumna xylanovorans]|uniref:FHA domain-containing protein n=1 Tax=Anaerocolumna xylanovorans DSM 12503 TaxID=1121345 RepID=A0A1M7YJR6_9FIRM|nr:DUF6382 domain-containing protein [Anaerocolumna xylanovorans]SHO52816.1 FHA domain-containing protein [Anaerocolumna xylanovorans DSM 12503]